MFGFIKRYLTQRDERVAPVAKPPGHTPPPPMPARAVRRMTVQPNDLGPPSPVSTQPPRVAPDFRRWSGIYRFPQTLVETGQSRSGLYASVAKGLFVRPIKIGPRASGFPSHEVHAIVAARVAGQTDEQIRALVQRLEEQRLVAASALCEGD